MCPFAVVITIAITKQPLQVLQMNYEISLEYNTNRKTKQKDRNL
jgi:hypothetical protein